MYTHTYTQQSVSHNIQTTHSPASLLATLQYKFVCAIYTQENSTLSDGEAPQVPLAKCSSILAVPLLLLLGRCEFHRGKLMRSTRKVQIGTLNEFNLSTQLKCVIKICILICQAREGREEVGVRGNWATKLCKHIH